MSDDPLYSVSAIKRGLASIGATYRQLAALVTAGSVAPSRQVPGRHLYNEERLWLVYLHLRARQVSGWVPDGSVADRLKRVPKHQSPSIYLEGCGPFTVTADISEAKKEFGVFMAAVQEGQSK
jgi:hypothetical protein